jgi:hypothetical protein
VVVRRPEPISSHDLLPRLCALPRVIASRRFHSGTIVCLVFTVVWGGGVMGSVLRQRTSGYSWVFPRSWATATAYPILQM